MLRRAVTAIRRCFGTASHPSQSSPLSTVPAVAPLYKRCLELVKNFNPNTYLVSKIEPPVLVRKPDNILVENWHRESAFSLNDELLVPIMNFRTGEYTGQCFLMDHLIFNLPLRRDIVHRVQVYESKKGKSMVHATKTLAEASDSNQKIRPQKGSGRARLGRRLAPGRFGGVKKHGRKRRMYDIAMPKKIRLLAMKTILSARFAEGRIVIVDNDTINEAKTKHVAKPLQRFSKNESFLLVTQYKNQEFSTASRNIDKVVYKSIDELTLTDILKEDKVMFTIDGILAITQFLHERTVLRHKPAPVKIEVPLIDSINRQRNPKKFKQLEVVSISNLTETSV
jgi:large subunit ribosomal protein L4